MKLQPWHYIAIPCVILSIVFIGLGFALDNGDWAVWGIPPFAILAGVYVLSPQVNWWWYKKYPPTLDEPLVKLLDDHFAYYQKLSPELKQLFRGRVAAYMVGNEFIRPMRPDDPDAAKMRNSVPEDLKAVVAALATQINFGKDNPMTGKFEHIVVYPHPFPSPQYEVIHTSEIFEQDGVVMLSANEMMQGFLNPTQFFSIGLYEFARIFKLIYPSVSTPNFDSEIWQHLEKISGMKQEILESIVGLPDLDVFAVTTHHFFTYPKAFQSLLPDMYQLLSNIYNQNPVQEHAPLLRY